MKKAPKIVVASTLGAALLLGGSTYALWNSSTTATTEAQIQIGGSDLTALTEGRWVDAVTSETAGTDVVIEDIESFRAVPSDRVTYDQSYSVVTKGENSTTKVSLAFEDSSAVQALSARGIQLTADLRDADGEVLSSSTATSLDSSFTFDGATPADGTEVEVFFTFQFDSTVTAEDTKNLEILVSSAVVTADQV